MELAPPQLSADSLLGNEEPDQAGPEMQALVAVGEPLMADQADGGEAPAQLLFGADAEEGVGGGVLESASRLDQTARREQLDAGVRVGAQAPGGIAEHARPSGDAHHAGFGDGAGQRVAFLISPQKKNGRGVTMPPRLRVAGGLQGDAGIVERRGVAGQRSGAKVERAEVVGIAAGADFAERGGLGVRAGGEQCREQRREES